MPPKNAPSRRLRSYIPRQSEFSPLTEHRRAFQFLTLVLLSVQLSAGLKHNEAPENSAVGAANRRLATISGESAVAGGWQQQPSPVGGRWRRGISNAELGVNGRSVCIPQPRHVPRIGYMTLQLIYGGGPSSQLNRLQWYDSLCFLMVVVWNCSAFSNVPRPSGRPPGWMAELLPLINKPPGTSPQSRAAAEKRSITRRGRGAAQSSLCFRRLLTIGQHLGLCWYLLRSIRSENNVSRNGKSARLFNLCTFLNAYIHQFWSLVKLQ